MWWLMHFQDVVFDNHSTKKAYPIQAVVTMNEIVLTDEQYNTIGQFHNSTAGHAGIDRTVKRMHKAGISWPYLRELVRAYIRMCPVCQKMSYLKVPIIQLRPRGRWRSSIWILKGRSLRMSMEILLSSPY
jgi:hypothetical protein